MTSIEDCIDVTNGEGCTEIAERAWSEYCRLMDVVEAAESIVMQNYRGPEDCDTLAAALAAYKEAKK